MNLAKGTVYGRNYVWDVDTLTWVAMRQPTLEADSVEVSGTLAVTGPQTDAEARAYQTGTGTITASGQSVTLALNGATGASVNFIDSSFNGTVRFYSSCDGGTTFIETQAFNVYGATGGVAIANSLQSAGITPDRIWNFALVGGETHVRVTSVSGSSGSVAVTIKANNAAANAMALAVCPTEAGDYGRPVGGIVMMARSGTSGVRSMQLHNARYEWGGVFFSYALTLPPSSNVVTITNTNDTTTSTQLASQQTSRLRAYVTNTSSAALYVLLENSGTASATRFTKRLQQWETWEVSEYWIGQIQGVWASDPGDGVAIVTEIGPG